MSFKEDLAYLAGIVDGEGCVQITYDGTNKRIFFVRLLITNTNENLLKWIKDRFGGEYWFRKKSAKECWKKCGNWRISRLKAIKLLDRIQKYLVIKKDQCLIAFTLQAAKDFENKQRMKRVSETMKKYKPIRNILGQVTNLNPIVLEAKKIEEEWLDAFLYLKNEMHKANKKGELYASS